MAPKVPTQPQCDDDGFVSRAFVKWTVGSESFDCPILNSDCPLCGLVGSIVELPPPLLAKQTDGTTHVCAPFFGGCNHGFAVTS